MAKTDPYARRTWRNHKFDNRTVSALQWAEKRYLRRAPLLRKHWVIAQGSYNGSVDVSGHGRMTKQQLYIRAIELDPRYVDHPTNRLAGLVTMVNMPPVSGRRSVGQYRGFIVGGRCTGRIPINTGNYEPFGYDYLIINSIDRIESLASNPTTMRRISASPAPRAQRRPSCRMLTRRRPSCQRRWAAARPA